MRGHPGSRALRAWAAGGRERLTLHLESCDGCQGQLAVITRLDPRLRGALERLGSPRAGFVDRLERRIEAGQDRSEALAAIADLFSLPWQVIQAMTANDPD